MIDFEQSLEACDAIKARLKLPFEREPGVTCTRTFSILPLRYAAIGGYLAPRSQLPELPEHLAWPRQAGALSQSSYGLRTLREGFLYVLEKRRLSGQYHWQAPYRVHPDGRLSPDMIDLPQPGAFESQDPVANVLGIQRLITVRDLDDLENIRLFFSPNQLTPSALKDLKQYRNNTSGVDIGRYAAPYCPIPEPNVLNHDQLDLVVDFAAESNPALRALLGTQLFNTPYGLAKISLQQALAPAPARIGPGKLNPQGVAIVVEDAIGITQELNAWRNSGLEVLKQWLESPTPADEQGQPGPTNEHKLLVAQAFTELHRNFSERKVAVGVRQHMQAVSAGLGGRTLPPTVDAQGWEQTQQALVAERGKMKHRELQARAEAGEFSRLFDRKYLPRVDIDAMHHQMRMFEAEGRRARRMAEVREADHLLWLQSPQLLTALHAYDRNDFTSGLNFCHQTGLCVMGMEAFEKGARLLERWWRAQTYDSGNLALRSFVYNQELTQQALVELMAQPLSERGGETELQRMEDALKQGRALATQFSLIDGHLDRLAHHGPPPAGVLIWIGLLGRETLRAGAPGNPDRFLHRRLSTYLASSLGAQAVDLRLAEHALAGSAASADRMGGPVIKRLDKAYVDTLNNAHGNSFYKTRIASSLLMLEASLLLLQGRREDMGVRLVSEVMASAFTTAAAGVELFAIGVEHALAEVGNNSLTARGAQISLARYRLWSVALASAGGVVSMGWDIHDAIEHEHKAQAIGMAKNDHLAAAYSVRAIETLALIAAQGSITFAESAALFNYLSIKSNSSVFAGGYRGLGIKAARLSINRVAMALLGRFLWVAAAAVAGATTVIVIVDEDALEKWCGRCCYRWVSATARYQDADEEMSALLDALEGVV